MANLKAHDELDLGGSAPLVRNGQLIINGLAFKVCQVNSQRNSAGNTELWLRCILEGRVKTADAAPQPAVSAKEVEQQVKRLFRLEV